MKDETTVLGTRLPAAVHRLLSPVVLASQPVESARFVPTQYVASAFYGTAGLRHVPPPRPISRLLAPEEIAELASGLGDSP